MAGAALLNKYGLEPKPLDKTNILTPEVVAKKMLSTEVLRVKDAPDMDLADTVTHFAFLLSDKNVKFVKGKRSKSRANLEHEIEEFSVEVRGTKPSECSKVEKGKCLASKNIKDAQDRDSIDRHHSAQLTVNVATKMHQEYRERENKTSGEVEKKKKSRVSCLRSMSKRDRKKLIAKAKSCLAWANDPARAAVPGAENMTNDQVWGRRTSQAKDRQH